MVLSFVYECSVYENKNYENLNDRKFCVNLDLTIRAW